MRACAGLVAISVLAVAVPAEAAQTVRWKEGARDTAVTRGSGRVVKTLGANGVAVSVEVTEHLGVVRVDLTVDNGPARAVYVDAQSVSVAAEAPQTRSLARTSADRIANVVERDAALQAASKRMHGSLATKTVVTTTTSQEPISGIRDYSNPNQPTYTKVETKVETVPDDHARHVADHEADGIRGRGMMTAGEIRRAALRPTNLARSGLLNGAVFFEADTRARRVVVRVEIDGTTFEIPFERVSKRVFFLGRRTSYE
jgi:hypothetical protein